MSEKEGNEISVESEEFGRSQQGSVQRFTLRNGQGMAVKLLSYGAAIQELWVPNSQGVCEDVVLGFPRIEDYEAQHPGSSYLGVTVGRYANRIAGGRFELEGKAYQLAVNNGPNHLHGGVHSFSTHIWESQVLKGAVKFTLISIDGDEGYPGALTASVTYSLTEKNELVLDYEATTDAPTIVNLTNHAFFNLCGVSKQEGQRDVLDHEIQIKASHYTPVDESSIPTGAITPVQGTLFDLLTPTRIGDRVKDMENVPQGFDHNFVLDGEANASRGIVATVKEKTSGRTLEMRTTEPGVQFYTGNYLREGSEGGQLWLGKYGMKLIPRSGFCLEAQKFPDSPNKPHFPTSVLLPGQTYRQTTVYRFV